MNIPFAHVFSVYGWLSELTYFRFFPVICWSYLRTEISISLSMGNRLYSRTHILYFSFVWKHFVDVMLRTHWICKIHRRQLIIIIIVSCPKHGYPWSSLATSIYCASPLAALQVYIQYPHIAAVCIFELVVLLLLSHMWGSIGVHHLWARPWFSRSVLHVWFVWLG